MFWNCFYCSQNSSFPAKEMIVEVGGKRVLRRLEEAVNGIGLGSQLVAFYDFC